jgi:hypothetical protein
MVSIFVLVMSLLVALFGVDNGDGLATTPPAPDHLWAANR